MVFKLTVMIVMRMKKSETDTENEEGDNNRESQEDNPVNGTNEDSLVIDITHQFSLSKQITDTGSVYQFSRTDAPT